MQRDHEMTSQLSRPQLENRQGTRFRADVLRVARCKVNYY